MEKYRDWDILEDLPKDWVIDKTAGSPAPNTVFITNGKSPLKGQKRALLKVKSKQDVTIQKEKPLVNVQKMHIANPKKEEPFIFPYKTVNDLARLKFKEQILKEIMFDLMVCEVEGWDKKEYINELKKLINGINTKPKKEMFQIQNDLFSCINT
jgi:hypothetical protein